MPFLDLRFVTSYTNTGAATACHTFQRRFSRRYLPYRPPVAVGAALAGATAQEAPAAPASGHPARQPTPEVVTRSQPASPEAAAGLGAAVAADIAAQQPAAAGDSRTTVPG